LYSQYNALRGKLLLTLEEHGGSLMDSAIPWPRAGLHVLEETRQ
jgi:hypothetical protein